MFHRIFKTPYSLASFFVIALVYLLVHFIESRTRLSGTDYILYFIIFLSGMVYTRKTLLFWFPDTTVAISLLLLAFSTNLIYVVSLDYQLQPVLLFSLYAMVLYLTAAWHIRQQLSYAVMLALALGSIILLQPTGVVSLLIPVLWGIYDTVSWKSKILLIKNNLRQFGVFAGFLTVFVAAPILFWNCLPGEIPVLNIKLPGVFYSVSSWFWNDLFSFDHGWFIYTPMMISPFIGFYFFAKKNPQLFYSVYFFFILDLFLETSWSKLGSTPVFGQVAFIPAYALLILPLSSLTGIIQTGRLFFRVTFSAVAVILIILTFFQTLQFNDGIILHSGMTTENYAQVFGRTGVTEIEKLQMATIKPDAKLVLKDENKFRKITLSNFNFEDSNVPYRNSLENEYVKSGKWALALDVNSRFSPGFHTLLSDFMKKPWVALRISAEVFAVSSEVLSEGNLIISPVHEGKNYGFARLNFSDLKLKPGIWNTVSLDFLIPPDIYSGDQLNAFAWYTGKDVIYFDDLKIEGFERKE